MLAMPEGYRAKDKVTLKSYMGSPQPQAVFDWVNFNLASRIKKVKNHQDLSDNWFHFENRRKREKIRVVLFSTMIIPPMFYSVMSVKFTGRVKFGTVNTDSDTGRHILSNLRLSKVPTYMMLTPESNKTFGLKKGEYLNYHSMALLLRSLHPEVNDIFLLSLIVINLSCFLEFFIVHGSLLKRLGRVLWDIVKWNFLLILLWLPILGLFQLPYMDIMFDYALTALRLVSMTELAGYVRLDWLWYSTVGWPSPCYNIPPALLLARRAVLFLSSRGAACIGYVQRILEFPVGIVFEQPLPTCRQQPPECQPKHRDRNGDADREAGGSQSLATSDDSIAVHPRPARLEALRPLHRVRHRQRLRVPED